MKIVTEESIRGRMLDYYESGGGQTFYVGFNGLAKYYSIKEGGVTDWTGYPGSGKTELLLEMLKNCSDWYGHKHLIYMPDAGTTEEVVAKLIHKFTGKQFEEFYFDADGVKRDVKNRITEAEMFRWIPEVLKMFKIYDPTIGDDKNKTRSKTLTPTQFWEYAVENKEKLGIFSAVIDSWNYMKHDTKGYDREDKWLEDTLSYRNELAERNNIHFHTIIHPKAPKTDAKGKIIFPDMHSLKGGSEWGNNGKSIIIVHRDFNSPITDVKIEKAKPRVVGVQGIACLKYDLKSGRWYENIKGKGTQKFYSHEKPIIEGEHNGMANDFESFEGSSIDEQPF